ncbi:MAG: helix-turn-helix domain-containing protein [archaeon]|nr:helix-turn-helix domain-containing protein [archaeon]
MGIKELIGRGESQSLEFKESLKLKDEIGETVSAFSNLDGGAVIIGVSDRGEVLGVDIGKNTLEEFANYIKRNTDPQIFPSVKIDEVDEKNVVMIEVKEDTEKPVFFKNHAHKRVGKTNQRISSSELRKLAKESGRRVYWDERVYEGADPEDIDGDKVRQFLRKAKYARRLEIDPDISVKEALERLSLIKEEKLTNAAILLFGKNPQRYFLQTEVRCARFKGTEAIKPFIDMKVFGGDIIEQANKALNFVLEHTLLSAWLVPGKVEREERNEYPSDAIREAIVNAICHRDYESTGNVQVRIFDDRIEVWNPGSLPEGWTVEKLKEKHESIPKNPLIADQFFLIKFIEKWGTGTIEMVRRCVEWGLPEPEFEFTGTSLIVTFRKTELTDEFLRIFGLNERQIKIVKCLKEREFVTSSEYEKMFGITDRQARIDLSQLVSQGLISKVGKARLTKYRLNPEISGNIRKLRETLKNEHPEGGAEA